MRCQRCDQELPGRPVWAESGPSLCGPCIDDLAGQVEQAVAPMLAVVAISMASAVFSEEPFETWVRRAVSAVNKAARGAA